MIDKESERETKGDVQRDQTKSEDRVYEEIGGSRVKKKVKVLVEETSRSEGEKKQERKRKKWKEKKASGEKRKKVNNRLV